MYSAVLGACIAIFRLLDAKDVFEATCRSLLVKRLLLTPKQKAPNFEAEARVITLLKSECGGAFTAKMEGMVADIRTSAVRVETQFNQWLDGALQKERDGTGLTPALRHATLRGSPSVSVYLILIYRYISCEFCSRFDSLPLIYLLFRDVSCSLRRHRLSPTAPGPLRAVLPPPQTLLRWQLRSSLQEGECPSAPLPLHYILCESRSQLDSLPPSYIYSCQQLSRGDSRRRRPPHRGRCAWHVEICRRCAYCRSLARAQGGGGSLRLAARAAAGAAALRGVLCAPARQQKAAVGPCSRDVCSPRTI